jgi:hypothetical protein
MMMRNLVSAEWLTRIAEAIDRDIAEPAPFVHGYAADDGQGRFHGLYRSPK